jgi:hypothetical protein
MTNEVSFPNKKDCLRKMQPTNKSLTTTRIRDKTKKLSVIMIKIIRLLQREDSLLRNITKLRTLKPLLIQVKKDTKS